jgi:DNA-binding NarL/FixJ family response regulator
MVARRDDAPVPRAADPALADRLATLTQAESRILLLVGEGLSNRQIAARVGLAEKTVRNRVSAILGKLGLDRRTQAALLVAGLRDRPA